jgi:hypothetical protein
MNVNSPKLEKFRQLVVDMNVQWQMYDDLFSDPQNYSTFDRTGPNFWVHLRSYLLDLLLLSIARFFDPPGTPNHENFSLSAVLDFPEVVSVRPELCQQLDVLKPKWERGIQTWRNKRLSHSDMPTVMGTKPLPNFPFSDIEDLITGISDFAREIDHRLNQRDVSYRIGITRWVPEVLSYLKAGIERREEKRSKQKK